MPSGCALIPTRLKMFSERIRASVGPAPLEGQQKRASRSAGRGSVMGRNALDALGQQITGRKMADVPETDDPDHPLALVDHRQPAELQLLHVMHRLCEVIVLPAAMDAFCHHIARHRSASVEVVARKPFAEYVAAC